ncbi:hypothetical protein [Mycobacterium hubeiense]|uniref:hypothetical protein n=1 Tax=Mycobacterium hubeiense TaxID=1867256 RepID=UPI0013042FF9|nr:hypothetical protein [Mycobacterium sp. QGD 101]
MIALIVAVIGLVITNIVLIYDYVLDRRVEARLRALLHQVRLRNAQLRNDN